MELIDSKLVKIGAPVALAVLAAICAHQEGLFLAQEEIQNTDEELILETAERVVNDIFEVLPD